MYSQWNTHVTGAWLVHLQDKHELEWLGVFTNGLKDEHLAPIAGLTNLKTLKLRTNQVTDAGMVHLRGLNNVTRLDLAGSRITSKGLSELRGMTGLTRAYLESASQLESLEPFRGMTHLTDIQAWGSRIDRCGAGRCGRDEVAIPTRPRRYEGHG